MDVYLEKAGAAEIHTTKETEAEWKLSADGVRAWDREAIADARSALSLGGSVSSGSSASTMVKKTPLSDEIKAFRKVIKEMVARSIRVFGIIHSSLPEELKKEVEHLPRGWAFGLWDWLEKKFQSTEKANVHALLGEWIQLHQEEDESFDSYRARVVKIATLLEHAKQKVQTGDMLVYIMLYRLLPRYKQAVMALHGSGKLDDADKVDWKDVAGFVNAHVSSEESLQNGGDNANDGAMAVRSNTFAKVAQSGWNHHNQRTGKPSQSSASSSVGPESNSNDRRVFIPMDQRQCYKCQKYGHISRFCPDRAVKDQDATPASVVSNSSSNSSHCGSIPASAKSGKRGQVQAARAVTPIIDENMYESLSESENDRDHEPVGIPEFLCAVRVVGIDQPSNRVDHVKSASTTVESTNVIQKPQMRPSRSVWGVDSMASLHVSGNLKHFRDIRSCTPISVQVADGRTVKVTRCGTVSLRVATSDGGSVHFGVTNVYYHECFASNLLSLGVLRSAGWEMHSNKKSTYMITPGGNKMIMLETSGRVSIMKTLSFSTSSASVFSVANASAGSINKIVRLHEVLGHMGFDRLVRVIKSGATLDVEKYNVSAAVLQEARHRIMNCSACTQGKGHRISFGDRGLDTGNGKGETLHMDTFFIPRESRSGRKWMEYALTVTDPNTRFRWMSSVVSKDVIPDRVIAIIRNAQTQLGCKVKRLYADGGSEFINRTLQKFCTDSGIELHNSPPRTQQLNGIAERGVRTIKETMHTIMLAAHTPQRFWARAAAHGVFVWNRTTVEPTSGITPYEAMYGKKPSIRHWGVFGCDAFVHVPKGMREHTFAPKMEPCIYLGQDWKQNCPLVYVLSTNKIIASRDVVYRESDFSHAIALNDGENKVKDVITRGFKDLEDDVWVNYSDDNEVAPQGGKESSPKVNVSNMDGSNNINHQSGNPPSIASPGLIRAPSVRNNRQDYERKYEERKLRSSDTSDSECGDEEFEVESVVGKRSNNGGVEYQIKWRGYDSPTWESEENVTGASRLVAKYEESIRGNANDQESDSDERVDDALDEDSDDIPVRSTVPTRESRRLRGYQADPPPQVHMCMSAIRDMQSTDDQLLDDMDAVVHAVSEGVGLLDDRTPQSHSEAVSGPDADKWTASMDKEIASCLALGVWELVPRSSLPKGTNILPVRWVYKIKTDENGNVTIFKSRVTPKGFRQKYGQDFFEVHAATGMYKTMRLGLSLTAKFDHELEQLDVPTAFLNADVDEEVYMEIPEGYRQGKEDQVCKLKKALYGLKQAPRNWYLMITKFIVDSLGFKATVSDPCLFHKRSRSGRLMLLYLFVDDFQSSFHREDREEWNESKSLLVSRFNTKDMGESKWILGMAIKRDRAARTITLTQELYITKALEKYGLTECKITSTPEVVGRETISDAAGDAALDQPCDRTRYMEITGTIMYAAISTRLEMAHTAHQLACNMQSPTLRDMLKGERGLRYLAGTRDIGLIFGNRNGDTVSDSRGRGQLRVDVCAYADADWANSKVDRKSISGWVAKLNGDPVSWSSKKQRTVALSTCEAELYAEAAAIQEVLWLRGVLKELGLASQMGSVVNGDNQSAIAISKNGVKGERTKHIDIKYHFVTETVRRGDVILKWIPTTDQQADIFTKALGAPVFEHFRKQLMTR